MREIFREISRKESPFSPLRGEISGAKSPRLWSSRRFLAISFANAVTSRFAAILRAGAKLVGRFRRARAFRIRVLEALFRRFFDFPSNRACRQFLLFFRVTFGNGATGCPRSARDAKFLNFFLETSHWPVTQLRGVRRGWLVNRRNSLRRISADFPFGDTQTVIFRSSLLLGPDQNGLYSPLFSALRMRAIASRSQNVVSDRDVFRARENRDRRDREMSRFCEIAFCGQGRGRF